MKIANKSFTFIVTSRGNYGKFKYVISNLKRKGARINLILGGMITLEKFGKIQNFIDTKYVDNIVKLSFVLEGSTNLNMAKSMGLAIQDFSQALINIKSDFVFVVGDRFETLAAVISSSFLNLRIIHLEGGEFSGSIDEPIRHSISKFSHLHFVCTDAALKQVLSIGENPKHVFNIGSTSFDIFKKHSEKNNIKLVNDYAKFYGFGNKICFRKNNFILVSLHPVTTEQNWYEKTNILIDSIQSINDNFVWILPNMDAGSDEIFKSIRHFREKNSDQNIYFFKSCPIDIYANLLINCKCIIGNSSSGIRESAYVGKGAINLGTRQSNRERNLNVIDCRFDYNEIKESIAFQKNKKYVPNHSYGSGNASLMLINTLEKINNIKIQKEFFVNENW